MEEYWKGKLPPCSRRVYTAAYAAFSRFEECVSFSGCAPEEAARAYGALCNDHPELYHLAYDPRVKGGPFAQFCLCIDNLYDRGERRRIDETLARIRRETVDKTARLSEREREIRVCDYLLSHTRYAVDNKRHQNAASVLVDGVGQCSGIAKAAKLLLGWAGVWSIVVNGMAQGGANGAAGPHAWNVVRIGGQYHHLDVTFMLGANPQGCAPFRYPFLNYGDARMRTEHTWTCELPPCTQEEGEEEKRISSLYELRLRLRAAAEAGKRSFTFFSAIPAEPEKLMGLLQSACRSTVLQPGAQVRLSICGESVIIEW